MLNILFECRRPSLVLFNCRAINAHIQTNDEQISIMELTSNEFNHEIYLWHIVAIFIVHSWQSMCTANEIIHGYLTLQHIKVVHNLQFFFLCCLFNLRLLCVVIVVMLHWPQFFTLFQPKLKSRAKDTWRERKKCEKKWLPLSIYIISGRFWWPWN